jgi:two-component system, NarL family, response regulator NreC
MPIRLVLADDHTLVRQSLRSFLEREGIQVVGEASDGRELIDVVARLRPEVAVLDISMPLMNGLEATSEIRRASSQTKMILLTRHDEDQYVTEALRMGVKGYVLKNQAATDLVQAIYQVCRGGFYLSPGVSRAVIEAFLSKTARPPDPLTSRERQVLQLISEGKSTKDVACLLGISAKTAESHRARLMHKLDIHEIASLVRYAIRRGLIQP